MKQILKYSLPIAATLLLVAFFTGLPYLKTCLLPGGEALPHLDSKKRGRRTDALIVLLLSAAYALTAFTNLGNTTAPQSFEAMEGKSAYIELLSADVPSTIMLYTGIASGSYDVYFSGDGLNYIYAGHLDQDHAAVLKWHNLTPEVNFPPRFVYIDCVSGAPYLGEVVLLNGNGQIIPVRCDIPSLCDEQELVPEEQTYLNSSYFDEIYHARTAWEHLHNIWPYEVSHPPLGKIILSLGISLFGMTPFGWRFMGTLFGVLMLPVMYLFLKKLFGGRAVPTLGTLLFASDFMHYTQTRIATIDTYAVFFILLMYLFMYLYITREDRKALALSGLFFGLGAASKWTCIYAGAGLAVIWALHWLFRFIGAAQAVRAPAAGRKKGKAQAVEPAPPLLSEFVENCLFCVLFFVILPCLIYYFSYIPYGLSQGVSPFSGKYLRIVLDNQKFMFTYHVGVDAEHPYSSRWYQWVLNIRPILYYLKYYDSGLRSSICAFLNPAVCWGGLLSLFVLVYTAVFRRDRKAAFIVLGYLAQLVPWIFISRITFEYHYFPSTVFLILAICYVFRLMKLNRKNWAQYCVSFTVISLLLFCLFFPVLGGLKVDNSLYSKLVGWLPTWPI